jgi:hypothetical protein
LLEALGAKDQRSKSSRALTAFHYQIEFVEGSPVHQTPARSRKPPSAAGCVEYTTLYALNQLHLAAREKFLAVALPIRQNATQQKKVVHLNWRKG